MAASAAVLIRGLPREARRDNMAGRREAGRDSGGNMKIATRFRTTLLAAALLAAPALAQDYPSRAVTIVVPFAAGGTVDLMGRIAADALQKALGQNFVVENRTGAGGVVGNQAVARAAPDGHTLLLAPTAFAIVPWIYKSLQYDPLRDFRPVGLMGYTANVMVVSPTLKIKTVREFIDLAKASPQPLFYASPGVGTPQHLLVEYFASQAGIKLAHVPYGGSAPALNDVMSGQIPMMFADIAPSVPLIESGKIVALGALTPARHPSLPDVPAISETLPGFSAVGWQGLLARAGTPDAVIDKLNAALVAYLKTPEAAKRMRDIGVDVKWTTPKEAQEWIESQLAQFEKLVKAAGIQPTQ